MTTFFSGIFFDNSSCETVSKNFLFPRSRFNLNFQRGEHNWLVSFSLPTNADRLHLCKLIDSDQKYLICYVFCYEDNSCWEKTDSLLASLMPRLPFINCASDFFLNYSRPGPRSITTCVLSIRSLPLCHLQAKHTQTKVLASPQYSLKDVKSPLNTSKGGCQHVRL